MRKKSIIALVLLLAAPLFSQTAPAGWKVFKDAKGACQMAVPPEWEGLNASNSAAILHEATTALAVVTSQPEQAFKPLTEAMLRMLGVPKDKLFENTPKRLFYQDRASENANDPNSFSSSVPAGNGTCSCRVVALPSIPAETAKKIVLTLGPAEAKSGS